MKKILLFAALLLTLASAARADKKSISILGDSYSTFEGYVYPDSNLVWYHSPRHKSTDVDSVQQTWWSILTAPRSPYRLDTNNSYSGATICYTGYNGDDYSDRAFVTRMDNLGSPDIILVFGATNDSWAGSPIGEYKYGDWTKEELYEFRPAMACMLDGLQRYYPAAKIYFIINTDLKPEIVESVRTICNHYKVNTISLRDIEKKSGHPTVKGMESIARQVGMGMTY